MTNPNPTNQSSILTQKAFGTLAIIIWSQSTVPLTQNLCLFKNGASLFDQDAWIIISLFMLSQLFLMQFIAGKKYIGAAAVCLNTKTSIKEKNHQPWYYDNGFSSYCITMIVTTFSLYFNLIDGLWIYNRLGCILMSYDVFGWFFITLLYAKGYQQLKAEGRAPTNLTEFMCTYYDGCETYPNIHLLPLNISVALDSFLRKYTNGFLMFSRDWNLKFWTNCRVGMMWWPMILLVYLDAHRKIHGEFSFAILASVALQLIYVSKFFWWESGYAWSMDIQHDKAGYYICWGCLVWVPCYYTLHTMYLVEHAQGVSDTTAVILFVVGVIAVLMNYDADLQRQEFRNEYKLLVEKKDSKEVETEDSAQRKIKIYQNESYLIWGKPVRMIKAKHAKGESYLLVSGYWAISRHFHYIPEIIAAFCWSCCCFGGFDTFENQLESFVGLLYPIYLIVLLFHRSVRDDEKCYEKYGEYWEEYRTQVPAKVVPGIF